MIRSFSETRLGREIEAFLIDRRARGLSLDTLRYYKQQARYWYAWCQRNEVHELSEITPRLLRTWLVDLSDSHNAGGVHAAYRAIRAFLHWAWVENELPDPCPVDRVAAPRVPKRLLDPVPLSDIAAMLKTCQRTYYGDRDRAILGGLLETGCRASEFVALNIGDVSLDTGAVRVIAGKGNKDRITVMGDGCIALLARYLRHRAGTHASDALWLSQRGARLTYEGLRSIVRRRANRAGIPEPQLHAFRRAFALESLRRHMDPYTLMRLMGHEEMDTLKLYLKQTESDLIIERDRLGLIDDLL